MEQAASTLARKGEHALQSSPLVNGEKAPAKKSKSKKKEEPAVEKKAEAHATPDKKVTVEVKTDAQVNGNIDGETTSVKVSMPSSSPELPLPQSTEEVIATAKEMVAEARKLETESSSLKGGKGKAKGKRKLDEVKDSEDDDAEEKDGDERSTKRTKVMYQEVRKQKVRNRALIVVGLSLAVG